MKVPDWKSNRWFKLACLAVVAGAAAIGPQWLHNDPVADHPIYGAAVVTHPASAVRISAILGTTGDAVITAGSTTYGTDRTAQLQSLLNTYAGWHIIGDGRYSHTGLTLPSNTDIEWLPGCGTILRSGSNAQLYQNANLSLGVGGTRTSTIGGDTAGTVGNITDQHVRFSGGIHNCNVQNQTATSSSSLLHGTRFWGVQDIWFEDVTFIDGSLWFANCQDFGGRNVTSINSGGSPAAGPQLNGPCRRWTFDGVTCINPADDGFAVCADDGNGSMSSGFPYPYGGPVTDGTLRNFRATGGQQGLRFLSTSQRIDRVLVDGVSGDTKYEWCLVTRFVNPSTGAEQTGTTGPGNVGSITIKNIDVNITAIGTGVQPHYTELDSADVFIDALSETLSFGNWKKDAPTAIQPALFVAPAGNQSGLVESLTIDNFTYREPTSGHTGPCFLVDGNVILMRVNGATVDRTAAGDSPLITVDSKNSGFSVAADGPSLIQVTNLISRNANSTVEVVTGSVQNLLSLSGVHVGASGNAAVTVATGSTVGSLDTRSLNSALAASKKWSGAGTVTNYVDSTGTYPG